MTSSLIGTAEQYYIRKHIKKQDQESPEGPGKAPTTKRPRRGPSWFERIQKRAEEAQKLRSQKDQRKHRK